MTEPVFSGTFRGEVEGSTITLTMSQEGSEIDGVGKAQDKEYRFEGTVEEGRARGKVEDAVALQSGTFEAKFEGDALIITLSRRFLPMSKSYRFTRV